MKKSEKMVHPYIPNSAPKVKAKMLEEIGVKDIDELYKDIPENLRLKREMDLCMRMTIRDVAEHTGLHWATVKAIDRRRLRGNLPFVLLDILKAY